MDSAKWKIIKKTFSAMIELPENQRTDFLENIADEEIRAEVKNLWDSHEQADDFIDKPVLLEQGLIPNELHDDFIGKRIENYLIGERIGTGGMGVVYLAERINSDFKQKVALKIIKRGMDSEAILKRFANERRILSTLKHPNIAQLLDGGISADGLPFFVMEYVDGNPLNQFCNENNLSLNERLELFLRICAAVEHAHKNLIIHRDLKPSNILVINDGIPKLLDFGIAKLLSNDEDEATLSATQVRAFTPEYASPEQISGKYVNTATDVYSLGVILYELLSGHRPFETKGKSFDEIVKSVCETEPTAPSLACDTLTQRRGDAVTNATSAIRNPQSLRGDLDNIILKAIRKNSLERYDSVQQFSEDIHRFLQGLPILARPQTLIYRFGKYFNRNKLTVSAATAILISLLGGISVASWQAFEAKRERDKANQRFEKLRDVAKLLTNETNDSLLKIPGNLKIQNDLVEQSVELLNSIYEENDTNSQFLSELANSYDKLCRNQFYFYRDFQKAEPICQKAIEIRRRVVGLEAENPQKQTELTQSMLNAVELYQNTGNLNSELTFRREIEKINRKLAKDSDEQYLANLGYSLIAFSQRLNSVEMNTEAKIYQKEGAEILQKLIYSKADKNLSPPEKTDLAWKIMWLGEVFKEKGDYESALKEFNRAKTITVEAYQADKTLGSAFNHASRSHRDLGEIYEKLGDHQKAFEMYKFSFDWLKTRENDPSMNKNNLIFGIFFYANRCALMLNKLGKQAEAEEIIKKPLADYTAFLDSEENAASLAYAAEPFADLTKYFTETNQTSRAIEIWEKQSLRLQNFLDKNPNDYYFRSFLADAQNKMGEIFSEYDETSDSFKTNNKEQLKKAKFYYARASEIYQQSHKIFNPTQQDFDSLQKVERKIARLNSL